MKKRCVITGCGIISALGDNWQDIFFALKKKENAVKYMNEWDKFKKLRSKLACPALPSKDDIEIPRKMLRGMGSVAINGVKAAHMALKDASLLENDIVQSGECGIAYGSSFGSFDAIEELFSNFNGDYSENLTATTYIKIMPQTTAVNIAVIFSVKGRIVTTDVACASSNYAIGSSYELISQGKQKVMIAGGGDEMKAFHNSVFDVLMATSEKNSTPKLTPRPFDKNRDGLVIGEGSCVLILEEYEHAKTRGAKIIGEVVGFAQNSDGRHVTQPTVKMMSKCMELAIEDANIDRNLIGYVSAHGTATVVGDIEEATAVYDVFKRDIAISSLKSYIGHTLAGCGAIETYVAVKMMNENWFHPNINMDNIDEKLPPLNYISADGLNLETDYVMCNNFAFGGINTALIIKRYKEI